MLSFASDYTEGAHPKILERLTETNFVQVTGYGTDEFCESAADKIRKACSCPKAEVRFISGGTQANLIVIDSLLTHYEGVIAATTGHINGHEAAAIERTGHKVLTVPHYSGKVKAEDVKNLIRDFYNDDNHEHQTFPGMVYVSNPTEYGTLYTKKELTDLSGVCREYNIPLFLDGARLGYGLAAKDNDLTLNDLCELCDVFYIGGTKVGALCGEAVVFPNGNLPKHFLTTVKQHGALLAKGRLLGVQFEALFTDNLYFELGENAIDKADKLRKILKDKNYPFFMETTTNQIFVVVENGKMEELKKQVVFGFWEKFDESHTVIRFATSWATTDTQIELLKDIL